MALPIVPAAYPFRGRLCVSRALCTHTSRKSGGYGPGRGEEDVGYMTYPFPRRHPLFFRYPLSLPLFLLQQTFRPARQPPAASLLTALAARPGLIALCPSLPAPSLISSAPRCPARSSAQPLSPLPLCHPPPPQIEQMHRNNTAPPAPPLTPAKIFNVPLNLFLPRHPCQYPRSFPAQMHPEQLS